VAFYLYAIAPAGTKLGRLRGMGAEPLRALAVDGLVAVAGEREALPAATVEALQAQDLLIRALAARVDALLPARFGTHERSAAALVARLEPHVEAFTRALEEVLGCEQMNLRLFVDARPGPSPPRRRSARGGAGTRYLLRAKERLSPSLPELEPLRTALGDLLRGERVKGSNQPPLRASVSHLIPRGNAERYQEILTGLDRPEGTRWLATGPFPPYAFAPEALS
jgi:hypothetical protein